MIKIIAVVLATALVSAASTLAYGATTEYPQPTTENIAKARELAKMPRGEITWWRNDRPGLILGYDERWKPVAASQPSSLLVLDWLTAAKGKVMARCYIEVSDASRSSVAGLDAKSIHFNHQRIVKWLMASTSKRDPEAKLLSSRPAVQDNHQAIYTERVVTFETIRGNSRSKLYSLVTAWDGYEVNLECGSEVTLEHPELAFIVEDPILTLMSSLQFRR